MALVVSTSAAKQADENNIKLQEINDELVGMQNSAFYPAQNASSE